MADRKLSVESTISAAEARAAATEGYVEWVDPTESDVADRNKRMTREELAKLYPKFSPLSGTVWNGTNKYLTLNSNTVLTFTPGSNQVGQLLLIQDSTGGRTVSINGDAVTINSGAGSKTMVTAQYIDGLGEYLFFVGTPGLAVSGGGGGLTALNVPGSFNANAISDSEIDLSWTDTNTSPNESGYTIYWNGTNDLGTAAVLATPAAGATSYNHTGLGASTSFYYWIKANGDGVTTSNSATATDTATTMSGTTLPSDYYIAAVTAQGVNPNFNAGLEALVRACIDGLDADGVLVDLVNIKFHIWNDPGVSDTVKAAANSLNAKSNTHNGTYSAIGAWTFADDGVIGDPAFSAYINQGVNPSTDLLQDDNMIFAYVPVGGAISFQCIMGCSEVAADKRLRLLWSGGSVYGENNAIQQDNGALALPAGFIMNYRDNSTTSKIAVDGTDVKTIPQTSTGLPNAQMTANFDRTDGGTLFYGWGKKITITGSGKAMDATRRTAFAARIATLVAGL